MVDDVDALKAENAALRAELAALKSSAAFGELSEAQLDEMIDRMSALFVGLPMVTGAPMIMPAEYYLEVSRHLIELGARIVAEPIKTYEAPTDLRSAGKWTYVDGVEVETPQDRIKRQARAERAEYLAEVKRRREAGTLKSARPEFGDPVQPPAGRSARKSRGKRR